MKARITFSSALLLIGLLLGACGPSPEQAATMTASAWTPTPVPPTATPSPTPMPYDLSITVVDEQGNPISWAQVAVSELNQSVSVDAAGRAMWKDLSDGKASVQVTAQGYAAGEEAFALERGLTEASIVLVPIPYGLMLSQACLPGETLLYAEDFQDGAVENWGTYPQDIRIPIESASDAAENQVLSLNFGGADGEFQIRTIPLEDNVVRRIKYRPGDHSRFNMGWGQGNNGYFVVLSADEISLNYYSEASGEQKLSVGGPVMSRDEWHLVEISSYNGKMEVWADGKLAAASEGTSLSEGKILGIGSAFLPPESIVHIDDISICGLNASFQSIWVAAP